MGLPSFRLIGFNWKDHSHTATFLQKIYLSSLRTGSKVLFRKLFPLKKKKKRPVVSCSQTMVKVIRSSSSIEFCLESSVQSLTQSKRERQVGPGLAGGKRQGGAVLRGFEFSQIPEALMTFWPQVTDFSDRW